MKKIGKRRLLILLIMALALGMGLSGCGETGTMISLNQEFSEMEIYELNEEISLDIRLSDELLMDLSEEERLVTDKVLALVRDFSVRGKVDTRQMICDLSAEYRVDGAVQPFLAAKFDTPGQAFYVDLNGLLDWLRDWKEEFTAAVEEDLGGRQWLRFTLDEDIVDFFAEASEYNAIHGVTYELAANYLLGLENEVFDDFDSGLTKQISGGVELRLTYEQTAPYIQALGAYALDHLDEIREFTIAFLKNIPADDLQTLNVTADETDRAIEELEELFAEIAENRTQYDNYLYMAVKAIEYPDIAKLLGGSYLDLSLQKKGGGFVWKYDVLINLNTKNTTFAEENYGDNSIRFTLDATANPLTELVLDVPASGDVVRAEDTVYFADFLSYGPERLEYEWNGWEWEDWPYGYYDDSDYESEWDFEDDGTYEDDEWFYDADYDWDADDRPHGAEYTADLGEPLTNQFFAWTATSCTVKTEIDGRVPSAGYKFILVDIQVENVFNEELPLGNFDFELVYEENGEEISIPAYDAETGGVIDGMYPDMEYVAPGDALSGFLLFEAPATVKEAQVVYLEVWADDYEGDKYYYNLNLSY
ncbi:MAG: DUF4352 domain-containing protein [Gracilibacteraceae bacterium]|nr:DUF4352 domain-containing protein [Gracilibacteraceae bacterium]